MANDGSGPVAEAPVPHPPALGAVSRHGDITMIKTRGDEWDLGMGPCSRIAPILQSMSSSGHMHVAVGAAAAVLYRPAVYNRPDH